MLKKLLLVLFILVTFTLGICASSVYREFVAKEAGFNIEVDEEKHKYNMPIVIINDRTYVPIRELAENMGMEVNWDDETNTISISTEEKSNLPLEEDLNISRKGTLDTGIEYSFYPEEDFSYESFVNENPSVESPNGVVSTAKKAAEIAAVILGVPSENYTLNVRYDKDADVWVVFGTVKNMPSVVAHASFPTVVIRRGNGEILGRYIKKW